MGKEFLHGQLNIPEDGAKKAGPDGFAGMYRDRGYSAIKVLQENMTAAGANNGGTKAFQGAYKLLALRPRQASHTDIC